MLSRKLLGHYGYYGITGNYDGLARFYHEVRRVWLKWLSRRSHKARRSWEWFVGVLAKFPLPKPRVVHSIYRLSAKP